MKKRSIKLLLLFVVFFTASLSASAQIFVKLRPPVPVIVRPPQPSTTHIWIHEEWQPDAGSYRYSGGHWEAPPQRGYYRRPGHWKQTPRGQVWVQGGWKKKYRKH